jgi:molybdopterin-containing oxidoreductase family membrane subunit
MELSPRSQKILAAIGPELEGWHARSKIFVAFLLLIILVGCYALFEQIYYGHVVTGMRDHVVWGLYIANFIFFIGMSYAGAMVAGILHLFQVKWRKPIMRIAILMTISAAIIGPVYILLCMGRFDRLHYLILHPRLQSPIIWDVMAISTYLVGAILFLYLLLIRDFAIYRDNLTIKVSELRRKWYSKLALGYVGTSEQKKNLRVATNLLALILIPMVVVISSVLSWIFGMTLRPGWHSTIFGPYFVIASVYTGIGAIILVMWFYRKIYKLEDIIQDKHFTYMGYLMLVLAGIYGYFTFSEYLTNWYGSEKWESEVVDKLLNPSQYGWWFLSSNVFGIIVPIVVVGIKKFRTPNGISLAALFMVFALWIKRYLIVVPTLESPLLPIQDIRPETVTYSATWHEWALTLAGIATFFLIYTVVSKFVAIIGVAEYDE